MSETLSPADRQAIEERLKDDDPKWVTANDFHCKAHGDVSRLLSALSEREAECERMRKALKPFVAYWTEFREADDGPGGNWENGIPTTDLGSHVDGWLKAARAALAGKVTRPCHRCGGTGVDSSAGGNGITCGWCGGDGKEPAARARKVSHE